MVPSATKTTDDVRKRRMVYACAGASNVGQLSNDIAVELSLSKWGKMGCLVGIAANVSTMVDNAKAANMVLAIDGCGVACARKVLEAKGLEPDSIILTEMGVEKDFDLEGGKQQVSRLTDQIADRYDNPINIIQPSGNCSC